MREKPRTWAQARPPAKVISTRRLCIVNSCPGPRPNPALTRGSIHFRRFAPQLAVVQPLDTLWSPRSLGTMTFRDFKASSFDCVSGSCFFTTGGAGAPINLHFAGWMLSLHLQNHDICLHKADLDPDGLTSLWRPLPAGGFCAWCAQADSNRNDDRMTMRSHA